MSRISCLTLAEKNSNFLNAQSQYNLKNKPKDQNTDLRKQVSKDNGNEKQCLGSIMAISMGDDTFSWF